mmetsp:Transcript_48341/g.59465  ORF Transcript_48341/g.59465 Transcript_48341/m.59465 type:complete len:320 (-) Transcript_48341:313-1272(-)
MTEYKVTNKITQMLHIKYGSDIKQIFTKCVADEDFDDVLLLEDLKDCDDSFVMKNYDEFDNKNEIFDSIQKTITKSRNNSTKFSGRDLETNIFGFFFMRPFYGLKKDINIFNKMEETNKAWDKWDKMVTEQKQRQIEWEQQLKQINEEQIKLNKQKKIMTSKLNEYTNKFDLGHICNLDKIKSPNAAKIFNTYKDMIKDIAKASNPLKNASTKSIEYAYLNQKLSKIYPNEMRLINKYLNQNSVHNTTIDWNQVLINSLMNDLKQHSIKKDKLKQFIISLDNEIQNIKIWRSLHASNHSYYEAKRSDFEDDVTINIDSL